MGWNNSGKTLAATHFYSFYLRPFVCKLENVEKHFHPFWDEVLLAAADKGCILMSQGPLAREQATVHRWEGNGFRFPNLRQSSFNAAATIVWIMKHWSKWFLHQKHQNFPPFLDYLSRGNLWLNCSWIHSNLLIIDIPASRSSILTWRVSHVIKYYAREWFLPLRWLCQKISTWRNPCYVLN